MVHLLLAICRRITTPEAPIMFRQGFSLGPFAVDAMGRLSPRDQLAVPGFSVRWRGRRVHIRISGDGQAIGRLTIQTNLGRIPSTVSSPERRAMGLAAARSVARTLPETWRLRLSPDYQQSLDMVTPIALPITAIALITQVTAFLLDLSPWLDQLQTGDAPA